MSAKDSDFIDFSGLLSQYAKKWWLFAISVFCCLGIAALYIYVHKPKYVVRANLLINQDESPSGAASMNSGKSAFGSLFGNDGFVYDEIFIISSHSTYKEVAKNLGLGTKYYVRKAFLKTNFEFTEYPIKVTPAEGMLDTLSTGITFVVKADKNGKTSIKGKAKKTVFTDVKNVELPYSLESPFGTFTFTKTEYYPADKNIKETIEVSGYDAAAEALDLTVGCEIASKKSNVVEMVINTPYPAYGKSVLNEIVRQYNKRSIEQKNDRNNLSAQFIEGRLDILSRDLNNIELEIQNYKQKKGIVDVSMEANKQFTQQTKLENSLLALRTQEELLKMASEFISDPANNFSLVPVAADDSDIPAGLTAYNELILRRQEMLTSARGDNLSLQLLDQRIDAMRDNIKESFAKTLDNIELKIHDTQRTLNQANARLGSAPADIREYIALERQQQLKQSLYLFLLQRREEVSMILANAFPKGTVVDEAFTLSKPLGLGKSIILALALIFGFIIPPVYLFVKKLITNKITSRRDVEKVTDIPILGEMCTDKQGGRLIVRPGNNSSAAELFRLLRTNLLFILSDNRKVVLLTSWSPGEGKSFISINLAASLAAMGKKVLLVGMDIRKPTLAKYLDINPQYGLTQYLSSSDLNIGQLIAKVPGADNLSVIVAGPIPPNPAELLTSEKIDSFFNELRSMYDYIIVDTAPIGQVSDTFTLDRVADATIFVSRMNRTKLGIFEELNSIYSSNRLKRLSIVINGTETHKNYGYGN